jgi:NADPH:quinone reductase-like Zn-dependent oxidoreductase
MIDTFLNVRRFGAATALSFLMTAAALAAAVPAQQTAIVQHEYGSPEVLKLETIPVLEPGAGQVLVEIYAAGVNPVDWKMREGINGRRPGAPEAPRPPLASARIPGGETAGVVVKVGAGVTELKVGQSVAGAVGGTGISGLNGAYSHYALAMANRLIQKPRNLSYAEAAGLSTAANTAALAVYRLKAGTGRVLLITGVAGGVGSSAAQIAKANGAHVVGTASARHNAYLKSIGVDEVVDYTQGDWTSKVSDVDAVLDTVGGPTSEQALGALKKGGLFVGIATENGEPSAERCTSAGVTCVQLRQQQPGDPNAYDLLGEVGKLAAAGKLKMHVDKMFPLEQAGAAQEYSRQGHAEGKIVLVANPRANTK